MSGLSWLAVEPTASFLSAVDVEPGPAGAEARGAGFGEVFLELGEAAELGVDRRGELALGGAALARADHGPEEGVVAVAAGVVAHAAADGLGHLREVGDQRVDVERGEGGVILEEIVGVGDVGLVVLRVVDFHRLRINVRDEGVVSVGEFREFVGHGRNGLGFIVGRKR
jgi:hypothetical protein